MSIVKDLMVPLQEYTRVSEDATLYEAVKALEDAMVAPSASRPRPNRAVLVQRADGRVLGKLSLWDILHGLEPRYGLPVEPLFMVDEYFTWTHAMFVNLAAKAKSVKAKDLVREHTLDETIDENAPLDQAVHQLVQGKLLSLMVGHEGNVVGVLRLSDVFVHVSESMDAASAAATAG